MTSVVTVTTLDPNDTFTASCQATARVMLGGEYLIGDHVPVRLGYRFDQGAIDKYRA